MANNGTFITMKRIAPALVLFFSLALTAMPSHADAISDFNRSVGEAYASYRSASNYLRTGNPGLASLEIANALETWHKIVEKNADQPPAPYARDKTFAATLGSIEKSLNAGLKASENEDDKAALKALEPVRDQLYTLRKRNGIRLYADCITELNNAIEPLYAYRHHMPDLSQIDVRQKMTGESETYANLLKECRAMAPTGQAKDQEFVRLFDGTADSIHSMFPAIDSKDPGRVINILRELRSFDRIIYFRFGG